MFQDPGGSRPTTSLAGADLAKSVRGAGKLLAAILLLALLFRLPGFTEPWSGKGFNAGIGSWTTGEGAKNFVENGFLEAGFLPNRWRIELADGSVEREWYAHHPAFFVVVSGWCLWLFGDHEWTIRLPWLLFSLGAVWAGYRLFETLWGQRVALLGGLALAVLPLAAHYSLLPWVDTNAMPFLFALFVRRYVLWLRDGRARDMRACGLYALLGGLLDWNMVFIEAVVLAHAAVALRKRGLLRLVRETAWIPLGVALSVAIHGAHMLAVMPLDAILQDTGDTWTRTTAGLHSVSAFASTQLDNLRRVLTAPVLWLLALAALHQAWHLLRGKLNREDWLLVGMLLPGPVYVSIFPYRGINHDFMWALCLPWMAASAALVLLAVRRLLGRAGPALGASLLVVAVAGLSYLGGERTIRMWQATSSDAMSELVQEEWFAETFSDPDAVAVTSVGQTWMMLYYSRTPIVPRIKTVGMLEDLRERILSRLGPDRPVYFVFDLQLQPYSQELYDYLREAGSSEQHLDYVRADPTLAFELFDLSEWARS